MKKIQMLLMALLVLAINACQPAYESVENDPMQTRIYTLDNGLKVYMSVNENEPRIQTYVAVRAGGKNDPAETTGLAHYFEHLMLLLALIIMLVVLYVSQRMYRLRHRLSIERELNDAKLRFFTDISHELRTPLSLIDGPLSEVLDDKKLSDQSRYYLEVVQKNVRRMLNLVNQILDFRKLQNKKMKYLLEHIDAESELKAIMENFIELAQHHHIDFSMETCGQEARLWVDRDKSQPRGNHEGC